MPIITTMFIITFIIANKITALTFQFFLAPPAITEIDSLPTIQSLPYLEIELTKSIPNRHYRIDGAVNSIEEHEKKLYTEFGFPISAVVFNEKEYDVIFGNCLILKNGLHKAAITMWKDRGPLENMFVATHEEMHVVQEFKIKEAYQAIQERFRKLGYYINFKSFAREEEADLAGILLFLEKGYKLNEIETKISSNLNKVIAKLNFSKSMQNSIWNKHSLAP